MQLPDNVTVLGDPHLGRKFKTGVPLHRVGDREATQWADFSASLFNCTTEYHINMGDLFDKFVVAPEIVLRVVQIYKSAAAMNPKTIYVVIAGNHDLSKDNSKASSFDLFAHLVAGVPNIAVVQDSGMLIGDDMAALPYHPFRSAEEILDETPGNLSVVFGHWDIQDWGGHNVIPTELMSRRGIQLAVSGHDHLAREEKRNGVDILVTGSMQPYSHAEDNTGAWYRTVTLEQLAQIDPTGLNIRVLLKEGETLPADIDCLSLTAKRVESEDTIEVDTSDFDSLDLGQMLARELEGLSIKNLLMEAFANAE